MELFRVHRASRGVWWFASLSPENPGGSGGRFDLPLPHGSCYLATTRQTAVLEALQDDFGGGKLPVSALRARSMSRVVVPGGSPPAADLTGPTAAGAGVTVGLWADNDRRLTQQWAVELHGSGWQALYHGAQHQPTGRGRSVTLFDRAGAHVPWGADWQDPMVEPLATDRTVATLSAHGISVSDLTPDLEMLDTPPRA